MTKITKHITVLILVLCPIMQFIDVFGIKFNFSVADFLLPLCGLLWLFNLKKVPFKKNLPFICYFLLYLAAVTLSGVYNFNSTVVSAGISGLLAELVKIIICAAYFFICYNGFDELFEFERMLYGWAVGLWIFMLYGLTHLEGRFSGTFTDANGAGTYLIFSFFMMWLLMIKTKFAWGRLVASASMAFAAACILLTQSRGSWAGFLAGLILLAAVYVKKIYKAILLLIPLLAIIYMVFLNVDFNNKYAISESISSRVTEAVEGEGQFIIRKNLSLQSLMMGRDHPVIGVGKGNFNLNSKEYADQLYNGDNGYIYAEMTRSIPHNTFAGMLAETGTVGFLIFSSIFVYLMVLLSRKPHEHNKILIVLLVSFFVQSLTLNLENTRIIWIFLALCFKLQALPQWVRAEEKVNGKLVRLREYGIGLAVIAGGLFIFTALRVTAYEKIATQPVIFEIPAMGTDIELVYNIISSSKHLNYIQIYKNEINEENLLDTHVYFNGDGYGRLTINQDAYAQTFKVVFRKESEDDTFLLRNLYYDCEGKKISLMDYKFLTEGIRTLANQIGLLSIEHLNEDKLQGQGVWETVSVGDSFDIVGVKTDTSVKLDILYKKKTESPKRMSLRYISDNIWTNTDAKNQIEKVIDLNSISQEWEEGKVYTYEYQFKSLEEEYFVELLVEDESYDIGSIKTDERHIVSFFDKMAENDLIFLAIMDEGTHSLDARTIYMMKKLGLSGELLGKNRFSYVAVVSKKDGFIPFEQISNEKIYQNFNKGEFFGKVPLPIEAELISAGFDVGNTASIVIDNHEYSQNSRGINIVVYDMDQGQVSDSIAFDTFASIFY